MAKFNYLKMAAKDLSSDLAHGIKLSRDKKLLKSLRSYRPLKELAKAVGGLVSVFAAHTCAMSIAEGLPLRDAWWLSVTTLSTTGYGDISPQTDFGRVATLALPYTLGIPLVGQCAALWVEWRQHRKSQILEGRKKWTMNDHIVFLNIPKTHPKDYYTELMRQLRKSTLSSAKKQALIVSSNFVNNELPDKLRELDVAHVSYNANDEEAFEHSSLKNAAVIVVLCRDEDDPDADSIVYHQVSQGRRENPNALIIAEVVHDRNKDGVYKEGANHILRPMRTYPAMLARAILAPGSEQLAEDIFSSDGTECVRYDVDLRAKWAAVACPILSADIGSPVAYVNRSNKVIAEMKGSEIIDAKAIMVLARAGDIRSDRELHKALEGIEYPEI